MKKSAKQWLWFVGLYVGAIIVAAVVGELFKLLVLH